MGEAVRLFAPGGHYDYSSSGRLNLHLSDDDGFVDITTACLRGYLGHEDWPVARAHPGSDPLEIFPLYDTALVNVDVLTPRAVIDLSTAEAYRAYLQQIRSHGVDETSPPSGAAEAHPVHRPAGTPAWALKPRFRRGETAKQADARRAAEVKAHDCQASKCGPVCTFGDW